MNLLQLHQFADNKGVEVVYRKIDGQRGACVKLNDITHILLNRRLIETDSEERFVLAHELGHYTANAFYGLFKVNNPVYRGAISRAEKRGNNAALRLLVPIEELKSKAANCDDDYEIAAHFDVDISVLRHAVEMYRIKGEL